MPERKGEQGTGRHPHKDTREPWPHTIEEGKRHGVEHDGDRSHDRGQSHERTREHATASAGASHGRAEDGNLKSREYRGDDWDVHHHTRAYMEQHRGESGEKRGGGSRGGHKGGSDRDR
jgi:hypothetical protein